MALTLDTTIGGADANSYANRTEADDFFCSVRSFFAFWDNLTDGAQDIRLVEATRALDSLRAMFLGNPVTTTQALEFPRDCQTDTAIIPDEVKEAQFQMIIYLEANPALTATGVTSVSSNAEGDQLLTQVKALRGLAEVSYAETRNRNSATDMRVKDGTMEAVIAAMQEYLIGGGISSSFSFLK